MLTIITEPRIYLVGRQQVDESNLSQFLADHDVSQWTTDTEVGGEKLVEVGGRLCYVSFAKPRPGGNAAYIKHILEVGHGSVLEHAVFNLIITGVSRSFTHELVRHRVGMGYSQLSQRFVDESNCSFVVPPAMVKYVDAARNYMTYAIFDKASSALASDPQERWPAEWRPAPYTFDEGVGLRWIASMEQSQRDYTYLSDALASSDLKDSTPDPTLRRKAAREAARSVLPNATETKIFVTGNARAFRHLIEMRGDIGADAEIRRVAIAVLRLLQAEAPNLFGDYQIVTTDGVEHVTTEYRKV